MAQFQNLLLQSQTLDNASWAKVNATVTADNTTAPNGTATADRMTDDGTNARHQLTQTWSTTPAGWTRQLTLSCYAKAGVASWFELSNSDVAGLSCWFNVSTGVIGTTGTTITEALIESVGSGWYRCSITFPVSATTSSVLVKLNMASADGTDSYAGGTGTLFLWGAQMVLSNQKGPYVATTSAAFNIGNLRNKVIQTQNLTTYSQDFSNIIWTWSNATLTGGAPDPFGGVLGYSLIDNSANNVHSNTQPITGHTVGAVYTASCFAKSNSLTWLRLGTGSAGVSRVFFNLATGAAGTVTGANIISWGSSLAGNGFYRCWITYTAATTESITMFTATADNVSSYVGSSQSIYTFGAQVVKGYGPGQYTPTTSVVSNPGGPRNLVSPGQNFLTFSQTFQNAAHTLTNITTLDNQTTAPDGTLTAAKFTTSNDGGAVGHGTRHFSGTTTIGYPCMISAYLKAGTRNFGYLIFNSSGFSAIFDLANGVVGTVSGSGNGQTSGMEPVYWNGVLQTGWYRCWTAFPWSGNAGVGIGIASSATVVNYQSNGTDTIFAWGMQFEQINPYHPGKYIPTTTFAVNNTLPSRNLIVPGQNFCLQSETFGTTWSGVSASVSSNAITAPDGTLTADKIVEASSGSTQHRLDQLITTVVGQQYTASVFVKAGERTQVQLRFVDSSADVGFDLTTVAPFSVSAAGLGYGISAVPGQSGWYRCWVSAAATATTQNFRINMSSAGNNSYVGDGTSGLYVWGACLTKAANNPGDYNSAWRTTTVAIDKGNIRNMPVQFQNLLVQSQTLDNASWTKTRASISANATTAPDGTATADTLIEDNTAGATHQMTIPVTVAAVDNGKQFCGSIYIKAASGSRRLSLSISDNTTGDAGCIVDVSAGTVVLGALSAGSWTGIGYGISPVAGQAGWYRAWVYGTLGTGATTSLLLRCLLDNGSTTSYNGDSASGLNLWGAGMSRGNNPGVYQATVASALNAGNMRNLA